MTTKITFFVEHNDVVDIVGIEDALRGWSCFENGYITDPRKKFQAEQRDMQIWARCADSNPKSYHVSVALNHGQVTDCRCTCSDAGACKHVAALLYTWIHDPDIFETAEDWRTEIALWSRERLLDAIFAVAQQSAEAEALLQAEVDDWNLFSFDNIQDAVDGMRTAPLWKVPALADELVEEGYEEQAVLLLTERLGGERSGILVDWLIEHYERVSDYVSALTWARRRLDDIASAPYYATVWSIGQRLGVWAELRPVLLARLRRANFQEFIKVLLLEGRAAEALDAYDEGMEQGETVSDATRLRLAEIAESINPERAVALYAALVSGLIERRTREYYRMAATLLTRVESLYGELGQQSEWQLMFVDFVSKYPRRPVLFEELERVNLLEFD